MIRIAGLVAALCTAATRADAGLRSALESLHNLPRGAYSPADGTLVVSTIWATREIHVEAPAGAFAAESYQFDLGSIQAVGAVHSGVRDVAVIHVRHSDSIGGLGPLGVLPSVVRLDSLLRAGTPADQLAVELSLAWISSPGIVVEPIDAPLGQPYLATAEVVVVPEPAASSLLALSAVGVLIATRALSGLTGTI